MKPIKMLDTSTINKIAAGEVVERPASVVKELIENSIDASASAIAIEIKEGGIGLIRVTDNGSGIEKEQVKTAFLRHATSKITSIDDIFTIYSLGFRGEALASIAAVSQLEVITKTYNDIMGKHLELQGGDILLDEDIGCPNGTTFIIKNLFFNTPARYKFLKKPATEAGYISEVVNKIAMGHPEISFKFINNGSIVLHTPGNNSLKSVVLNIYGKEVVPKLLNIEYQDNDYKIEGLIGKPELNRANRNYENIFINGRYIKSDIVKNAAEEAYKTRIMIGKFPLFILNILIPSEQYDVNVHPTKQEVKFNDEDRVYNLVFEAISKTLQQEILIPKTETETIKRPKLKEDIKQAVLEPFEIENKKLSKVSQQNNQDKGFVLRDEKTSYNDKQKVEPITEHKQANTPLPEEKKPEPAKEKVEKESINQILKEKVFKNYRIVGQIFNTYWIVEMNDSIYMIDQHAAHEKILYERFLRDYNERKPMSQILLQPLTFKVNMVEGQILKDNRKLFEDIGYQFEEFGENTYIVRSVPIIFNSPESITFFTDILDTLGENSLNSSLDLKLDKIASLSCKAAVKAKNKLSNDEAVKLIEELLNLENPFNCPHGRPTIIEMSKYEIEKKFKRIV